MDYQSRGSVGVREVATEWVVKSVSYLWTLKNPDGGFFRSDKTPSGELNPTATFQAIEALCVALPIVPGALCVYEDKPPETPCVIDSVDYEKSGILEKLLGDLCLGSEIESFIGESSLTKKEEGNPYAEKSHLFGSILLLERMTGAILAASRNLEGVGKHPAVLKVIEGVESYLDQEKVFESLIKHFGGDVSSPNALLTGLLLWDNVNSFQLLRGERDPKRQTRMKTLADHLSSVMDYHMARAHVPRDSNYDPISLVIALRGVVAVNPAFTESTYCREVLKVVLREQREDGCWPDGVCLTFNPRAEVVQLPSVAVAEMVADSVISPDSLVSNIDSAADILELVMNPLRKVFSFLENTVQVSKDKPIQDIRGWTSDRTRQPNSVETWVTAIACRFIFWLSLGERALVRADALKSLGVGEFRSRRRGANKVVIEDGNTGVFKLDEVDSLTKPIDKIRGKYCNPILQKRNSGKVFHPPEDDACSFVLFGPPGSGKTFAVKSLAESLDWPLVEIGPGHFINNGLELIESTAAGIFDYIERLEHAVVFFDECDELFRDRDEEQAGARGILSFATASMLPKIQNLHDKCNVLFVLGTNYLGNIDKAIRRPGRFDDLILLDKPDETCRRLILEKKEGGSIPDSVIQKTWGMSIKELKSMTQEERMEGPKSENSTEDYKDWCKTCAKRELDGSRFSEEIKSELKDRWKIL